MKIVTLLILLFVLASNGFCQSKKEYYDDYLFPNGYVGWVRVQHEVEGAPPLPVESGRTVFKFDESGVLKTSDKVQVGWVYPKYYYYTETTKTLLPDMAEGAGGMIHNASIINTKLLDFFVGTDHQYSLWYKSDCGKAPSPFDHSPGNIKQCLDEYEKNEKGKSKTP